MIKTMDTIATRAQARARAKAAPAKTTIHGEAPADLTALILAPRWRLGRRASGKRAVLATARSLQPLARRVAVACHGAAAPALRDSGAGEVFIVPDSESPLSALGCALDACEDELTLVVAAGSEVPKRALDLMLASLADDAAGVAAWVRRDGEVGFPLLCRASVRPIVAACVYAGHASLVELLRRPCARLITLD